MVKGDEENPHKGRDGNWAGGRIHPADRGGRTMEAEGKDRTSSRGTRPAREGAAEEASGWESRFEAGAASVRGRSWGLRSSLTGSCWAVHSWGTAQEERRSQGNRNSLGERSCLVEVGTSSPSAGRDGSGPVAAHRSCGRPPGTRSASAGEGVASKGDGFAQPGTAGETEVYRRPVAGTAPGNLASAPHTADLVPSTAGPALDTADLAPSTVVRSLDSAAPALDTVARSLGTAARSSGTAAPAPPSTVVHRRRSVTDPRRIVARTTVAAAAPAAADAGEVVVVGEVDAGGEHGTPAHTRATGAASTTCSAPTDPSPDQGSNPSPTYPAQNQSPVLTTRRDSREQ